MSVVAGGDSEPEEFEVSPITLILGSIIVGFIIYLVWGMASNYITGLISYASTIQGFDFYNITYIIAIFVMGAIGFLSGLFEREDYIYLASLALVSVFFITLFVLLPLASVGSGYYIHLSGNIPITMTGSVSGAVSNTGRLSGKIEQTGSAKADLTGSAVQASQGVMIQPLIILLGIIIILSAVMLATYFTGRIFRSYLQSLV